MELKVYEARRLSRAAWRINVWLGDQTHAHCLAAGDRWHSTFLLQELNYISEEYVRLLSSSPK